jgi:hypothetical protein
MVARRSAAAARPRGSGALRTGACREGAATVTSSACRCAGALFDAMATAADPSTGARAMGGSGNRDGARSARPALAPRVAPRERSRARSPRGNPKKQDAQVRHRDAADLPEPTETRKPKPSHRTQAQQRCVQDSDSSNAYVNACVRRPSAANTATVDAWLCGRTEWTAPRHAVCAFASAGVDSRRHPSSESGAALVPHAGGAMIVYAVATNASMITMSATGER